MTPHQCWNVCDWETTERDQPSEAQLSVPTCTQRKSRKPTFRLWPSRFRKGALPLFNPSKLFTQTGWHKGKEETPSFQRQTMSNIKISKEGGQPTQLRRARRSRSLSFMSLTTSLSCVVTARLWREALLKHFLKRPEHSERGEPNESELSLHESLISWHKKVL